MYTSTMPRKCSFRVGGFVPGSSFAWPTHDVREITKGGLVKAGLVKGGLVKGCFAIRHVFNLRIKNGT